jgi:hypothetical protein
VTTKTTFLEASAGLAITLGAASADDLQVYLDKIKPESPGGHNARGDRHTQQAVLENLVRIAG